MTRINPNQSLLLSAEYLFDINPLKKFEVLFSNLDSSPLYPTTPSTGGRPSVSKDGLLRALIYKNLKGLPTLYDLGVDLVDNPSICLKCGLPNISPRAFQERLSSFLKDTPNHLLQVIRKELLHQLIVLRQIKGKFVAIDSSAVFAPVKQNNLKTSVKDRFNKTNIPKADSDCRLSVIVHFSKFGKKDIRYFWGYRNHVICDAVSELPLTDLTKPANISEQTLFIPLFAQLQQQFSLPIKAVLADAQYDAEYILRYVVKELEAKPYIARNPRWDSHSDVKLSRTGGLICIAGFEMQYWGKFTDRGKIRLKFVCPITHSKSFRKQVPWCPWNHPKFLKGNGCTAYHRGDSDIRKSINYGSQSFKKAYNKRTGAERIFSRFLTLCMQKPSTKGLNAVANHCTVAHITVLLVALTATRTGNKDKTRFIKKFLPSL